MSLSRVQLLRLASLTTSRRPTSVAFFSAFSGGHDGRSKSERSSTRAARNVVALAVVGGAGVLLFGGVSAKLNAEAEKSQQVKPVELVGIRKEGLPEFTMQDVSKHDSASKRVWVTYKHGVYDITDFISKHPGADKIMMAAGGAVEPFWNIYAVHKKPEVNSMLEDYRIGNLSEVDFAENEGLEEDDAWVHEPHRHPALKAASTTPFNAETPLTLLSDNFITPNELFYVRNHLPVPILDEKTFVLEVEPFNSDSDVSFSLNDIKTKFQKHSITATIQCGGNRRADMNKAKPVAGLDWKGGAIGTAVWSGARLIDVLRAAGIKEDDPGIKHVHFEGADLGPDGLPYGASIPVEKALNPWGDVILAYEMNGEPLPRDHGFPLRVIVPGNVAARSVKWLQKIILSDQESPSHWQQKDYKTLSPTITESPDYSKFTAIQSVPITSAICEPKDGSTLNVSKDGSVFVKGYAYTGGGNSVVRVDVSIDGGKTWKEAELERAKDHAAAPRNWSWVLWKSELPVGRGNNEIEVVSRAVDSSNNIQPDSYSATWNLRGFLANAVSRARVKLDRS